VHDQTYETWLWLFATILSNGASEQVDFLILDFSQKKQIMKKVFIGIFLVFIEDIIGLGFCIYKLAN
jgi:hypothetical protein